MAIASWPSDFPQPQRSSYQRSNGDGRKRTQPDTGPARQRRRFSSVSQNVTMTFDLTNDQKARFDLFFDEELLGGAKPFTMIDPETFQVGLKDEDGQVLLDEKGEPIGFNEIWLVQFGAVLPSHSIIGVKRRVTIDLEILP